MIQGDGGEDRAISGAHVSVRHDSFMTLSFLGPCRWDAGEPFARRSHARHPSRRRTQIRL